MWVEFVVGSRPCSKWFFSGNSGFPLSSKTNISKFQFDSESEGHRLVSHNRLLSATLIKKSWLIDRVVGFYVLAAHPYPKFSLTLTTHELVTTCLASTTSTRGSVRATCRIQLMSNPYTLSHPESTSHNGIQKKNTNNRKIEYYQKLDHRIMELQGFDWVARVYQPLYHACEIENIKLFFLVVLPKWNQHNLAIFLDCF